MPVKGTAGTPMCGRKRPGSRDQEREGLLNTESGAGRSREKAGDCPPRGCDEVRDTPAAELAEDCSAVLCSYAEDRWPDTLAALDSLRRQAVRPLEILLVIDHNERLFELARTIEGVTLLRNSGVRGASGSRNTGAAAARGSVVAFLDDDAVADPDWLEKLLAGYVRADVVGVGGRISPGWDRRRPRWFPREFDWVVGCTYLGMPTTTSVVRNLIGANMSVRREAWEQVGGFREGFGNVKNAGDARRAGGSMLVGCEETEFCIRVSQTLPGARWIFEPRAHVRHRVPGHRCTWRYFLSRCRKEGWAKAMLVSVVGPGNALGIESSYVGRTLLPGAARQVRAGLAGDAAGFARAVAILAGLAMTGEGFLERRVRMLGRGRPNRVRNPL
jgi:glucosyl-dolichyl phosphate glucuronosyltransferase